ncbi:MAG: hypothetical protein U9N59_06970 [Campylobacterota bacterium]|nr:hypothetical protein [Campylobacterota bacterium]
MHKAAILELGNGHTETIYSQTLFLNSHNYEVHLIANKSHQSRIKSFKTVDSFLYIDTDKNKIKQYYQIKKYLKYNNINILVINTAAWSVISFLPFMLFGVKIIGITHGLEKLRNSFSQKLLSLKIKKYFVLSEQLFDNAKKEFSLEFSYFYPMFFQKQGNIDLEKKRDELWITIPGQLEYKRRDYISLIKNLPNYIPDSIKFIILGSCNNHDGHDFITKLKSKKIDKNFIFFDTFVDDKIFHNYLLKSDLILPLPPYNSRYLNNAISGTYNLAYAYSKAQLLPLHCEQIKDFSNKAIFYDENDLYNLITKTEKLKAKILYIEKNLLSDTKLSLKYQSKKYVDFINN